MLVTKWDLKEISSLYLIHSDFMNRAVPIEMLHDEAAASLFLRFAQQVLQDSSQDNLVITRYQVVPKAPPTEDSRAALVSPKSPAKTSAKEQKGNQSTAAPSPQQLVAPSPQQPVVPGPQQPVVPSPQQPATQSPKQPAAPTISAAELGKKVRKLIKELASAIRKAEIKSACKTEVEKVRNYLRKHFANAQTKSLNEFEKKINKQLKDLQANTAPVLEEADVEAEESTQEHWPAPCPEYDLCGNSEKGEQHGHSLLKTKIEWTQKDLNKWKKRQTKSKPATSTSNSARKRPKAAAGKGKRRDRKNHLQLRLALVRERLKTKQSMDPKVPTNIGKQDPPVPTRVGKQDPPVPTRVGIQDPPVPTRVGIQDPPCSNEKIRGFVMICEKCSGFVAVAMHVCVGADEKALYRVIAAACYHVCPVCIHVAKHDPAHRLTMVRNPETLSSSKPEEESMKKIPTSSAVTTDSQE
eukprot:g78253.t1